MLSISKSKYEPPWRSNPKFIFLLNSLLSILIKLDIVKKEIINVKIKTEIIFNFEKYNTLV